MSPLVGSLVSSPTLPRMPKMADKPRLEKEVSEGSLVHLGATWRDRGRSEVPRRKEGQTVTAGQQKMTQEGGREEAGRFL